MTAELLHLDEAQAAIRDRRRIYLPRVVAGVEALRAAGLVATCPASGRDGFTGQHLLSLKGGKLAFLFPEAGTIDRGYYEQLAGLAAALGCDARLVTVPGLERDEDLPAWLAAGDGPAALEALAERTRPARVESDGPRAAAAAGGPWAAAISAPAFLAGEEADLEFLVPYLLAPGTLTLAFSPRGLGKTHVAHALAVRLAKAGLRVLLLDRDNPPRDVRRRLRAWGAADAPTLCVMTRGKVPPLTDAPAWERFPYRDYDVVIIDSLGAVTEGIEDRDSGKSSAAIAAVLDVVHREEGPAVLALGNTVRTGAHSRGSGVVEDRADIVYEVRDATDLQPTGAKPWIEELPAADAGAWAARATRRQRRDTYRLAFVPTKFRPGEEPEPFILEVDLRGELWTYRDVTDDVDRAGAEARAAREAARQATVKAAAAALVTEVARRAAAGEPPLLKDRDAVPFLVARGLTRHPARALLADRDGTAWRVVALEDRPGRPKAVLALEARVSLQGSAEIPRSPDSRVQSGVPSGVFPPPASHAPGGNPARETPRQIRAREPGGISADAQTHSRPRGDDPRDPEPSPDAPDGAWGAWRRRCLEREQAAAREGR